MTVDWHRGGRGRILTMALAVLASPVGKRVAAPARSFRQDARPKLMTDYTCRWVMALLLTAAMLGQSS